MTAEYATAKESYKANRPTLKKYRGQWIAYTNKGAMGHDYRKMKDRIPPDTPKLSYVLDRIFESEFVETCSLDANRVL